MVSDKRLAIDMCGLRQSLWRLPDEEVGDPLGHGPAPASRNDEAHMDLHRQDVS